MTQVATLHRIQPARWYLPPPGAPTTLVVLDERARVLECARDGRALYTAIVAAAARVALERDPACTFAMGFARAYLYALHAWDRVPSGMIAAPWRAAFSTLRQASPPANTAALISLAAHLSYDAPLVLAREDAGSPSGLREIFDLTIDAHARGYRGSASLSRTRAREFVAWLDCVREQAWLDGMALADADESERTRIFARIEATAMTRVALIARMGL